VPPHLPMCRTRPKWLRTEAAGRQVWKGGPRPACSRPFDAAQGGPGFISGRRDHPVPFSPGLQPFSAGQWRAPAAPDRSRQTCPRCGVEHIVFRRVPDRSAPGLPPFACSSSVWPTCTSIRQSQRRAVPATRVPCEPQPCRVFTERFGMRFGVEHRADPRAHQPAIRRCSAPGSREGG